MFYSGWDLGSSLSASSSSLWATRTTSWSSLSYHNILNFTPNGPDVKSKALTKNTNNAKWFQAVHKNCPPKSTSHRTAKRISFFVHVAVPSQRCLLNQQSHFCWEEESRSGATQLDVMRYGKKAHTYHRLEHTLQQYPQYLHISIFLTAFWRFSP